MQIGSNVFILSHGDAKIKTHTSHIQHNQHEPLVLLSLLLLLCLDWLNIKFCAFIIATAFLGLLHAS